MTEKQLIQFILGISTEQGRSSTLQLALESARHHIGKEERKDPRRESFAGRYHLVDHVYSRMRPEQLSDVADMFSAILLYLIALEQIGTIFCGGQNSIQSAIAKFSFQTLSPEDCDAISGLRHSLAHSFGLVNTELNGSTLKTKYVLDETTDIIVQQPSRQCRNYDDKDERAATIIGVFPLCRLVEGIVSRLREQSENLTIASSDKLEGKDDAISRVMSRYTIRR